MMMLSGLVFVGGFSFYVMGQEDAEEVDSLVEAVPKMVRVQVEFIDVPHEVVTDLLFGEDAPVGDVEMRKRLGVLIKEGKASVMETMVCLANDGQKATTESVQEFIYPTEYEPAEVANVVDAEGKKTEESLDALKRDHSVGPTPSAFETKNVGSTFEVEASWSEEDELIHARLNPIIVYHTGNEVWAEWKGKQGDAPVVMPNFYKITLDSKVSLSDGKPMFLAVVAPKNGEGKTDAKRRLMVFVKADLVGNEK